MQTQKLHLFFFFLLSLSLYSPYSLGLEEHDKAKETAQAESPKADRGLLKSTLEKFKRDDDSPESQVLDPKSLTPVPNAPRPFDISYKVSLNGLPAGLKAKAKLRKEGETYRFELKAKNWVLDYFEKSEFTWNPAAPCLLQTKKYQFDFEGFGHREAFEVDIDPENKQAESTNKQQSRRYQVPGNVSDALAYLFKLQCDLKNDELNPSYDIAYEKGLDEYIFEYQGKETIRTSLGKLETIVLKRIYSSDKVQTTYWIAPELDYLMVRMRHKQGKIVTATLKVRSLKYLEE